jgi:hypothetical protein
LCKIKARFRLPPRLPWFPFCVEWIFQRHLAHEDQTIVIIIASQLSSPNKLDRRTQTPAQLSPTHLLLNPHLSLIAKLVTHPQQRILEREIETVFWPAF